VSTGNFDRGTHAVQIRAIDSAGNEVVEQVIFITDYCFHNEDGTTRCLYVESLEPEPEPIVIEPSYSDPPYVFVWVSSGVAVLAIIMMLFVISAGMRGPKKKKSDDDYDDDDWMSEFIGTSQDVDMDSITNTTKSVPVEEAKTVPEVQEPEVEEEDPFAVNVLTRKSRRTKAKSEPEPEDDDDLFFGLEDEDFEDEEVEEKPKPRRKVGRRAAPKNAPKRRPTRRKKSDD
jgi:hypothetical protein